MGGVSTLRAKKGHPFRGALGCYELFRRQIDRLLSFDILKRNTFHHATRSGPYLDRVAIFAEILRAFNRAGFF